MFPKLDRLVGRRILKPTGTLRLDTCVPLPIPVPSRPPFFRLTPDARQSLQAYVIARGTEIREKYGAAIGWNELQRVLEDRTSVRYPCDVLFDAGPLAPGDCAQPIAKGEKPDEGFAIYVHPCFLAQISDVPAVVLYQLVFVNYGSYASADDAEAFGAAALGLTRDEYYRKLCDLADRLGGRETTE
jgi:hypothetical protein